MTADLLCYVSAMGNGRTRSRILQAGWRLLLTPDDPREVSDANYGLDNGAWKAFQRWLKARLAEGMTEEAAMGEWFAGRWREGLLDEELFEAHLERYGARADWVVAPDIVACAESLDFSIRWMNRCLSHTDLVLIAVQNGMEPEMLEGVVGTRVGVFLGGDTAWKLANAEKWGAWCAARPCRHPRSTPEKPRTGCWFHYARVNTEKRFALAHAAGADSIDGSSVTKFSCTLEPLSRAAAQGDLYDPRRMLIIEA